jgi:hypothetical protein
VLCVAAFGIASIYPIVNYFVTSSLQQVYTKDGKYFIIF